MTAGTAGWYITLRCDLTADPLTLNVSSISAVTYVSKLCHKL